MTWNEFTNFTSFASFACIFAAISELVGGGGGGRGGRHAESESAVWRILSPSSSYLPSSVIIYQAYTRGEIFDPYLLHISFAHRAGRYKVFIFVHGRFEHLFTFASFCTWSAVHVRS